MSKFIVFFLEEQQLRWKVYFVSGCVAFAYALINLFAFHRSEERVGLETVGVLFLLVATFVGLYVAKEGAAERHTTAIQLGWRLPAVGLAGAVMLVSVYFVGMPKLQATVVDLRLKTLAAFLGNARAATLSDEQLRSRYKKIETIVHKSALNQIPVDPNLIQKTDNALSHSMAGHILSDQTKQLGWATSIDLHSFAITRRVQNGEIAVGQFPQLAPVQPDQPAYIQGNGSWVSFGPGAQIVVEGRTVIFDKVNFSGPGGLSTIELVGDRASSTVRSATLRNVSQYLDRIIWIDVRFAGSQIFYKEGAPLRLRDVSFVDCDLSHLHFPPGWGPISSELEKRITEAHGQPITFIYEPEVHP